MNDAIEDPVMSEKIDRIGEITGKILDYQRKNPNKNSQLRSFLNYYLPTTLKILKAYAQMEAQGIEGENISAAKERIEGMMDKVVEGFEKQLDKLFRTTPWTSPPTWRCWSGCWTRTASPARATASRWGYSRT